MIAFGQEQGSSLVEALVAAVILSTGVLTMAQLLSIATVTNQAAKRATVATIVAEQKLEELRARPWDDLQPSSSWTLEHDTDGYVDYRGVYTRRWSIEPVSADADSAVIIQVLVMATSADGVLGGRAGRPRGEARMVTVRARRAK